MFYMRRNETHASAPRATNERCSFLKLITRRQLTMQQIDHHNLARENEIAAVDPIFGIEVHGLDPIPSEHRHGKPRELLWTWLGGNFNYVVLASGAFTILFGLSFWQAITAAIVGSVLGAVVFSFCSIFGPRTATATIVNT